MFKMCKMDTVNKLLFWKYLHAYKIFFLINKILNQKFLELQTNMKQIEILHGLEINNGGEDQGWQILYSILHLFLMFVFVFEVNFPIV